MTDDIDHAAPEYEVSLRVRNNWLLRRMAQRGFHTVADLARATELSAPTIYNYLNFKMTPFSPKGDLRIVALKICEALQAMPGELWPPQHLETPMRKNTRRLEVSADDLQILLEDHSESPEQLLLSSGQDALISEALVSLTPREERVIRLRFGLDGSAEHTLEEVAKMLNVTRERIRQIELRALRKLKHPSRSKKLIHGIPWLENAISRRPNLRYLAED